MKKYLLLLLIAVCAVSCGKDEETEKTIFTKTYTMEYVKGDYSEIVEVKLEEIDMPNWEYNYLEISFTAEGYLIMIRRGHTNDSNKSAPEGFTKVGDNTEYILYKDRHGAIENGSFRIDNEKTSYYEGININVGYFTLTEIE